MRVATRMLSDDLVRRAFFTVSDRDRSSFSFSLKRKTSLLKSVIVHAYRSAAYTFEPTMQRLPYGLPIDYPEIRPFPMIRFSEIRLQGLDSKKSHAPGFPYVCVLRFPPEGLDLKI